LDNIDIKTIGLHHLRHKTIIIPQDPIMFTGNIRSNLDPFGEFTNLEIIEALEKTGILDQIKQPEKITKTEF
jgi:ATP-binding cassette, subfamily C (CFTR/MRP), member 1